MDTRAVALSCSRGFAGDVGLGVFDLPHRPPRTDAILRLRDTIGVRPRIQSIIIDTDIAIVGSGFAGSLTALALRRRGPARRADRARPPSPVRDRRVVHPAGQPAARGARGSLRSAAPPGVLEMGHLAAGASRGRRRSQTGVHFPVPSGRRALRRRSPIMRASCWSRRALTMRSATRIGTGRTSITRSCATPRRTERSTWMRHRSIASGRKTPASCSREAATAEASGSGRASSSTPAGRAGSSIGRSACNRRALRWLPPTQALYTHFEGVERWDRVAPSAETPPYPVDDAALHHVFDGGWIWVLRFNNGITSAGAALTDPAAAASARRGRGAGLGPPAGHAAVGPRSVSRRARAASVRARAAAGVSQPGGVRTDGGRCCRRPRA